METQMISKCLKEIEAQIGWGNARNWTTREFEQLSEMILEPSGVHLSVATLKRVWGKVKYGSRPSATTLNALAQFAGYEHWRAFEQEHLAKTESTLLHQSAEQPPLRQLVHKSWVPAILGLALIIAIWLSFGLWSRSPSMDPANFSLSSKKMEAKGVPNSVIFNYDASAAAPDDTIYIQQSWDERLRAQVSREQQVHTSIYYYPGFFLPKLVINGKIVQEHGLFIPSDGWIGTIEQSGVPIYLTAEEIASDNGSLSISPKHLQAANVALQPKPPWVSFHLVRTFGDLTNEDFIFETRVRNDYQDGAGVCQFAEVHLLFEGGAFVIPLSHPRCVSSLAILDAQGKREDPSALGVDFSDWVAVKIEFEGPYGKLYINDEFAYPLEYGFGAKNIVGVRYRFHGAGSVDDTRFTRQDGTVVYEETFEMQ
jgi:hypothetical protein